MCHLAQQTHALTATAYPSQETTPQAYLSRHQFRRAQLQERRQLRCSQRQPRGCCSGRRTQAIYPIVPTPRPAIQHTTPLTSHQPPPLCRGPLSTMASLVLAAIEAGAQKVQDKREKKRAEKASVESQQQQRLQEAELDGTETEDRAQARQRRKSEASRERNPSEERGMERRMADEDVAPPRYEDVVRTRYGAT